MEEIPIHEKIFAEALELESSESRARLLDHTCAGRPELRKEVESLLRAFDRAGEFLNGSGTTRVEPSPAPPQPAAPNIPGFQIEHLLGQGGIGQVFKAWDETLHRKVAVKTLLPAAGAESRQRILHEARKTAALRHPAIVSVHAVIESPPAIVMELVEGTTIDQYSASLSATQKARIFREIADALACAHASDIIHRDLKPGNVLVTPALRPVILDFGIAQHAEDAARTEGIFEGTPLYASPEQVAGQPVTTASDIFSFGSLMFRILTGRAPFAGETSAEVFQAIRSATPPFPRDCAEGIPADLQAICLACMAREPGDRPTATDVALDLGRFLAGEPIRLRPALYGDILRRRISSYSNDLVNWEHQGMISADERDRLQLVHRQILADEDHWLVDARRISAVQAVLYTSVWGVVVATGLLVWLARADLSRLESWLLPLLATAVLLVAGLLAERRREPLASASFLAGAVLSIVPATLSALRACGILATPAPGVRQLLGEAFTNQQTLAACLMGLVISSAALHRLRMTGLAWTSCLLGAGAYLGVLLQFNWLDQKPEIMALWTLPLASVVGIALLFERSGRIRWAAPFHLVAMMVTIAGLDVMAANGPTLAMLGLSERWNPYLTSSRQQFLSFALNGAFFLALALNLEKSRSLDLRRASRFLEIVALLHLLGSLYQNVRAEHGHPYNRLDVAAYLAVVALFLVLGPWRSRWRMLVGGLGGVALGSHLLIDLELVPRRPFILGLGAVGMVTALAAHAYLSIVPRIRNREAAKEGTEH